MKNIIVSVFVFGLSILSSKGAETDPNFSVFIQIFEKFYADLAKGDKAAVKPFALHHFSINDEKSVLVGNAFFRPKVTNIQISLYPSMVAWGDMKAEFKRMTKCDLLCHYGFIVRYPIPSMGKTDESKLLQFNERTYCDLWLYGSDGKWRVACDYFPNIPIDAQEHGIDVTENREYAEERQRQLIRIHEPIGIPPLPK